MTIDGDPACFTLRQDDSSRNVTENRAVCKDPDSVPLVEIHPQVGEAMTPATPHRPPVVRPSASGFLGERCCMIARDSVSRKSGSRVDQRRAGAG
jgi:hypothetical protein